MAGVQRRVGLFGGTFDPIHFGHLNLAIELMEKRRLDEVWFSPSQANPLKEGAPVAEARHRLQMLQLATEGIPFFKVIDVETRRPPPSYMVDTVNLLVNEHPDCSFYLLLGKDVAAGFYRWRSPLDIVEKSPPLIGCRTGSFELPLSEGQEAKVAQALQAGLTKTLLMDVSATAIRARLSQNSYCGHLVPAKVLDYIRCYRLYSTT